MNICTGIWLDIRTTVKKTITVHYITYFYFHQQENETIGGYSITASTINALYSLKKLGKGVSLKGNIKKQNSSLSRTSKPQEAAYTEIVVKLNSSAVNYSRIKRSGLQEMFIFFIIQDVFHRQKISFTKAIK